MSADGIMWITATMSAESGTGTGAAPGDRLLD